MNLFLELFLLLLVDLLFLAALSEVHHSPPMPVPTALLIASSSLHAGGRTLAEYGVIVPRCSTAQILVLFQFSV